MKWILDAIDAAKTIRRLRKMGFHGPIDMVGRDELEAERKWMNHQRQDNINLTRCIRTMIDGGSPCEYCDARGDCEREEYTSPRGCEFWCLMWPEEGQNDTSEVH